MSGKLAEIVYKEATEKIQGGLMSPVAKVTFLNAYSQVLFYKVNIPFSPFRRRVHHLTPEYCSHL